MWRIYSNPDPNGVVSLEVRTGDNVDEYDFKSGLPI
jgi:hypothetical protein